MEFGLFTQGAVHQGGRDADAEHASLRYEIELTKAADRSGFKYVWASEHHFLEEYSHLSSNEAWLAYVGAQTEQIHLGSGIFNVTPPVAHPARTAEKVAMLDHLLEGRFEFGTGRGSSTTEQQGFGIDDPELTRAMWDEVVPEIVRMWETYEYSFDGEFFSMPERNVLPKPYSDPHPPIWVACGSPGTFEKAARHGLGTLGFTFQHPSALTKLVDAYKSAIDEAEPMGRFVNDSVTLVSSMICMEDGAKAREWATKAGFMRHSSLVYRYLDTFPRPDGIPQWPEVLPEPTPEEVDLAIEGGYLIVGDPDECANGVQQYVDTGADQLLFGTTTLPLELAIESIETFGRHVLPRFDTDPVHRTTRQREAAATG